MSRRRKVSVCIESIKCETFNGVENDVEISDEKFATCLITIALVSQIICRNDVAMSKNIFGGLLHLLENFYFSTSMRNEFSDCFDDKIRFQEIPKDLTLKIYFFGSE